MSLKSSSRLARGMAAAFLIATASSPLSAEKIDSAAGQLQVDRIVSGLDAPWAVGFLPEGGLLITERDGALLLAREGQVNRVAGLPDIAADGQGGLLDVLIPRDFAQRRELFMTYAQPFGRRSATAVLRAKLSDDGARLLETKTIFTIAEPTNSGRHFGSRLVEAPDGHLFVTIGDRGDRPSAQDTGNHNGTVLKITRDGAAAPGNPGFDQPEIWSYGHRNPQGAALDASGQLYVVEHGARGGDEVNRVQRGANYGWPVISYGRHYSGLKIGEGTTRDGMEQPEHYWDPSIAPSGMMIYSGALWPQWEGDIFVGSLKFDYISRLSGSDISEVEQISGPMTNRVRDVREGPNGGIWFLSVGEGALYRITPG
ncbi:PQQ-dependent sugar dehydrogenase [Primorskyibacter sp. S187A]|uniref:PQQ-dependent sugar dehydrogenase n=1 Tax=Primorskyibacter sp. S187A TaxID=3415130 RepID=UPI003C7AFFAF